MAETKTTCPYCGVGCGVIVQHDGATISGVRGDPDHPANFGKLCSKGSTLHLTLNPAARIVQPEMRTAKNVARHAASWEDALEHVADKFAQTIRDHGPDSVGFYVSGQLLTEDYYVFNKLAKGLIGTNNIDTNSRLCMSSAVAGYKVTLGADAPPCSYEDIDHADCIFIVGSNAAFAHPILFRRIEAAKEKNPQLKIIVADPRRTDTSEIADLFLQITPGSDVALFHGLLHLLVENGHIDRDYIAAHTDNFAAIEQTVAGYSPDKVSSWCGVPAEMLREAASILGFAPCVLSLYCQGLNQSVHGTDKNAALINLHLAMGKIGKPGCGPFSLTGQPNAMGGREVGGMANLLSAHRDLANTEHRAEVAALWGVDHVPEKPGKTAVEMFDAVAKGEIKCLWIACTNPAQSMPDQNLVRAALETAELVVVQECFANTDTVVYADVLLPTTTWGEKDGTVTNSERRISRVLPAIAGPGEARHDWRIAIDFARVLAGKLGKDAARLFPYETAEQIWNEHRESTRGRDLDITGMSYAMIEAAPKQWPMTEGATSGKASLYEDGIFPTANGRARFHDCVFRETAETPVDLFPLRLTTGRLRDQWHGMSRTGLVAQLFSHAPEPMLGLHADDMAARGLADGDVARVSTRRGAMNVRVATSAEVKAGVVYLPMHWGSQFMSGSGINVLTTGVFDPVSKQPELKHSAVQVARVNMVWQMTAMCAVSDPQELMFRLSPFLKRFDYASLTPAGSAQAAVILRAFHSLVPESSLIDELDAILNLGSDNCDVVLDDAAAGVSKRARLQDEKLVAFRLAGEAMAGEWLKDFVISGAGVSAVWPWLFAPSAKPPAGQVSRGRIVCSCHDVAESAIVACLREGNALAMVQQKLKCGTGCGSCVPELRRMARDVAPAVVSTELLAAE
ncbi:MAG: molybdopterin-dependent oxidoreductase [Betaproteobacteria bacterium]|nr:molybdopterin-dependent oxidoreductase [Betaproteobacteria bacterium]